VKASRRINGLAVPSALCAMENGRYINVRRRKRVAAALRGVKSCAPVIQESS